MLKKSNIVSKKSNGPGKNPRDDTLRQRARREAGSCNFFVYPILLGRDFLLSWVHSSYINGPCPAQMAPVH